MVATRSLLLTFSRRNLQASLLRPWPYTRASLGAGFVLGMTMLSLSVDSPGGDTLSAFSIV